MKLDDLRARLRTQEQAPHPGLMCLCGCLATKRLLDIAMPTFECSCGRTIVEGPADTTRLHPSPEIVSFARGIEISPGEDGRAKVDIKAECSRCKQCQSEVRVVWAEEPPRFELECPACSGANFLEGLMKGARL